MFHRRLTAPDHSFFLFGPRGTGKTTWLREHLGDALWIDLVREAELMKLARDPDLFRRQVEALPRGAWIVVDEVQRMPALLGDVQDLVARHPGRYRFALTGSSARRLRREGANLLPGRVVNRRFFPLTSDELGELDVEAAVRFGCLPAIRAERVEADRVALLEAYVENYLAQEVRAEALVRRLDSFVRFLEVAALANGQVTNVSSLARDAGVARPTVQGYFDVLADTLLGVWLPAWRPHARVKEVAHPKFYFFDPGVVRALAGRLREPLEAAERGPLLETYVLHELRAWQDHAQIGGTFSYWRTPSGSEIDFVWTRGKSTVGIEVKSSTRWRREDGAALRDLAAASTMQRAIGVYLGTTPLRDGDLEVLPLGQFLDRLYGGRVLRPAGRDI